MDIRDLHVLSSSRIFPLNLFAYWIEHVRSTVTVRWSLQHRPVCQFKWTTIVRVEADVPCSAVAHEDRVPGPSVSYGLRFTGNASVVAWQVFDLLSRLIRKNGTAAARICWLCGRAASGLMALITVHRTRSRGARACAEWVRNGGESKFWFLIMYSFQNTEQMFIEKNPKPWDKNESRLLVGFDYLYLVIDSYKRMQRLSAHMCA